VILKDKVKENDGQAQQEYKEIFLRKDPKKMTIQELDEYLDKSVLNIKVPDRLNSSSCSLKFMNLNGNDPIKNKLDKNIVKEMQRTDRLVKEFKDEFITTNEKKSNNETEEKVASKSRSMNINYLMKSHHIPSLSSMLLNSSQFCKIKQDTDNDGRKNNEEKIDKLNAFLDQKLKGQIPNDEEDKQNMNKFINEKEVLIAENVKLNSELVKKELEIKILKDRMRNNEILSNEVERKLLSEITFLKNDNLFLKNTLEKKVHKS
jgi:hypothetical protein